MRISASFLSRYQRDSVLASRIINKPPVISLDNGTFYRSYPSFKGPENPANPSMFPGLTFSLPSSSAEPEHWAVSGSSSSGKTTLLEILRGHHICVPPKARSFPYLSTVEGPLDHTRSRSPSQAIKYVGFGTEDGSMGKSRVRGAYLSARYESRREDADFSVLDYLKGNTELNPSEEGREKRFDDEGLNKVIENLRLGALISMPLSNLSNGQTRRARIAKALLGRPEVLLLDEPFMGLDPSTLTTLSPLLQKLAQTQSPRLILALRPQDPLPDWITHLILIGPSLRVRVQGRKEMVLKVTNSGLPNIDKDCPPPERKDSSSIAVSPADKELPESVVFRPSSYISKGISREGLPLIDKITADGEVLQEPLVEMEGVNIRYGARQILGGWNQKLNGQEGDGLWWTVRRGERWGVFGPNGSGKTTLLSLICSDHPQSYSLPIKIFGKGRLPKLGRPGISIFDIQTRIGQSSPEIHAFFPRNLTIRQTIRNAWADTFLSMPRPSRENDRTVDSCLRWFEAQLNPGSKPPNQQSNEHVGSQSTSWADALRFGDLPFSSQRLALFLRAVVRKPDLVILDEAFSGMDDYIRVKCMLFLTWGETRSLGYSSDSTNDEREILITNSETSGRALIDGLTEDQALICISHIKEEVPGLVRQWICLPEAGGGRAPRFGRLQGPLEGCKNGWEDIWRS